MRWMQSVLFLIIGVATVVILGMALSRNERLRSAPRSVLAGIAVGVVGAFAVLPVAVDVVPDDLEPAMFAVSILIVSATLAVLGLRSSYESRH